MEIGLSNQMNNKLIHNGKIYFLNFSGNFFYTHVLNRLKRNNEIFE